jgi:hypothetical protein
VHRADFPESGYVKHDGVTCVRGDELVLIAVDFAEAARHLVAAGVLARRRTWISQTLGKLGRSAVWRWSSVDRWAQQTGRPLAAHADES